MAEGIITADLLHGPVAAVNADAPALLMNAGGPVSEDLDVLRQMLTGRSADVVELPHDAGMPESLRVITGVVRGQQLARAWALERGLDLDAPATLTKVTRPE